MALAAGFGYSLPPEPNAAALNGMLMRRQAVDKVGFADLCLSVVKLLGRGEYALEMPGSPIPGHFGLAVQDYTHATAPNRRYPDLLTQRLLKAAIANDAVPYPARQLAVLAEHCTVQKITQRRSSNGCENLRLRCCYGSVSVSASMQS